MITVHFSDALLALLIVALLTLHYVVHRRRVSERDALRAQIGALQQRVSELESLNASLGLRLMTMAEILARGQPDQKDQLSALTDSIVRLLHEYQREHPGAVEIEAGGDVNVGGDVAGRDQKAEGRGARQ